MAAAKLPWQNVTFSHEPAVIFVDRATTDLVGAQALVSLLA